MTCTFTSLVICVPYISLFFSHIAQRSYGLVMRMLRDGDGHDIPNCRLAKMIFPSCPKSVFRDAYPYTSMLGILFDQCVLRRDREISVKAHAHLQPTRAKPPSFRDGFSCIFPCFSYACCPYFRTSKSYGSIL